MRWVKCLRSPVYSSYIIYLNLWLRCARIPIPPKWMTCTTFSPPPSVSRSLVEIAITISNICTCAAMISKCISLEFEWIIVFYSEGISIGVRMVYTFRASIYEACIRLWLLWLLLLWLLVHILPSTLDIRWSLPMHRMRTIVFLGSKWFSHCGFCIVTQHRQRLPSIATHATAQNCFTSGRREDVGPHSVFTKTIYFSYNKNLVKLCSFVGEALERHIIGTCRRLCEFVPFFAAHNLSRTHICS